MALINCKECGKEISDKSVSCLHCGNPINQPTTQPTAIIKSGDRKCLKCEYVGQMKTWLRNYMAPQFIALLLMSIYIFPGLIFIAWGWGKYKCPKCGAIGNSVQAFNPTLSSTESSTRKPAPPSDEQQMEKYGITFDGKHYKFGEYKYTNFSDAINYAHATMQKGS